MNRPSLLCIAGPALLAGAAVADEKPSALREGSGAKTAPLFLRPEFSGAKGHQFVTGNAGSRVPVVVVKGTPYEMGRQLGEIIGPQMKQFVPAAMAGITQKLSVTNEALREVWARSAAFGDDRVEQELAGLSDGSGVPLSLLQAMHAVPLLMPYSCSSIAAWGGATEDGHLYQTRNLDWSLEVKAHEFPVIVVYIPDKGHAHVLPTFAGMTGAFKTIDADGIAADGLCLE